MQEQLGGILRSVFSDALTLARVTLVSIRKITTVLVLFVCVCVLFFYRMFFGIQGCGCILKIYFIHSVCETKKVILKFEGDFIFQRSSAHIANNILQCKMFVFDPLFQS